MSRQFVYGHHVPEEGHAVYLLYREPAESLTPRFLRKIRRAAETALGDDFVKAVIHGDEVILIFLKTGTSTRQEFALRNFAGLARLVDLPKRLAAKLHVRQYTTGPTMAS